MIYVTPMSTVPPDSERPLRLFVGYFTLNQNLFSKMSCCPVGGQKWKIVCKHISSHNHISSGENGCSYRQLGGIIGPE